MITGGLGFPSLSLLTTEQTPLIYLEIGEMGLITRTELPDSPMSFLIEGEGDTRKMHIFQGQFGQKHTIWARKEAH